MRILSSIIILMLSLMVAVAQPKVKREAAKKAQTTATSSSTGGSGLTVRAQTMFPTAIEMPEDVVWRRDIYREISLLEDANAGLYYPVEPSGKQMNLFTYIFKLALFNYIPVYEYKLDGNEDLTDSARVRIKTILDNYHIYYETKDGRIRVDNSDIPSADVQLYYLKESAYYDQANSTFRRKVLALCPVMMREDDFGGDASRYPLFWVRYSDLEPFLNRQTIQTSNYNNAASMNADDYFTLTKYDGKIYKTNNLLGMTLAQYCPTDSAMAKEQKRIEAELAEFEKNLFGQPEQKDSLDSLAIVDPKAARKAQKEAKKAQKSSADSSGSVSKTKKAKSSGSSSSGTRMSVRRERH